MTAALELAARGLGDTVALAGADPRPRLRPQARTACRFDPPLYDTFAFITRRNAHLSPATREFMAGREARRGAAAAARERSC